MDSKIEACRQQFGINIYPGNLFKLITSQPDYIHKYNLLLFREDIGKLSGFIGYGEGSYRVICINRNRPICMQNFTLAHEIGHMILNLGKSFSDTDDDMGNYITASEKDANKFAGELLYPVKCFDSDLQYITRNKLIINEEFSELAKYVNELCHKYFVSFELVLRKILYKFNMAHRYTEFRKIIEKSIGGGVSTFDQDFYRAVNLDHEFYSIYDYPYKLLKTNIEFLVERKLVSPATGEALASAYSTDGKK